MLEEEVNLKKAEVEAKRMANKWSSRWLTGLTPNMFAILGAASAAAWQFHANRLLEAQKIDYQIILKSVEQPTEEKRKKLLDFFVKTNSFSPERSKILAQYIYRDMEIPFAQSPVLEESVGKIMTKVPKGANQLEGLREALTEFEINTPLRQAAFLAIVAFESDELQMTREFANSAQAERLYGPATGIGKGLGNTLPGDGERFKGRGYIQIVGRNNYSNAGNSLGLDLLSKPELLEEPRNAWRAAGWYWRKTNINAAADRRDFRRVVNLINPGMLGYQLRLKYYRRALAVLSVNPGEVESLIYDGVDTGPKPR